MRHCMQLIFPSLVIPLPPARAPRSRSFYLFNTQLFAEFFCRQIARRFHELAYNGVD